MIDNNKTTILKEFEEHKGELVITSRNTVERFIGIIEDKYDYCYVFFNGREIHFSSCLFILIPLKNKIDDKYYNELVRLDKLNHYDQIGYHNQDGNRLEQIAQFKMKLMQDCFGKNDKLLAELCWDIN